MTYEPKQNKGTCIAPTQDILNIGSDSHTQSNKPGTGYAGSLTLGTEVFQAQGSSYVAEEQMTAYVKLFFSTLVSAH